MFKSLSRIAAVTVVLILVVSGLNISNQAINSLTMENKGPILALNMEDQGFTVCYLGTNRIYSLDGLPEYITLSKEYSYLIYDKAERHLYKTWNIFRVLVLYNL